MKKINKRDSRDLRVSLLKKRLKIKYYRQKHEEAEQKNRDNTRNSRLKILYSRNKPKSYTFASRIIKEIKKFYVGIKNLINLKRINQPERSSN